MIVFETEMVKLADLKPHPQNYQTHPQEQIEHLKAALGGAHSFGGLQLGYGGARDVHPKNGSPYRLPRISSRSSHYGGDE